VAFKPAKGRGQGGDVGSAHAGAGVGAWMTLAAGTSPLDAMRLSARQEQPEAIGRVLMIVGGIISLELDPPSFSAWPLLADPVLLSYAAIAFAVLAANILGYRPSRYMAPVDLIMALAAVAVTGGTSSPLHFFLLLPVISAAFHYGFERGATVTMLATVLLLIVGLPTSPGGVLNELNRAVLRPFSVLILGYLISRHGELQSTLRRRLSLMADLSVAGNPRFGVRQTIERAAATICRSYGVSHCILAYRSSERPVSLVVRASLTSPRAEHLPDKVAELLTGLSDSCVARVDADGLVSKGAPLDAADSERLMALRDVLGALPFLTLPLGGGGACAGRLYLAHKHLIAFHDPDEIHFLSQLGAHLASIIQRIDLLDHLASLSAQKERRRLAYDLHDIAIQPYLGLQLALAATLKRTGVPVEVKADLQSIAQLAQQGVAELRRLLSGERAAAPDGQTVTVVAIADIAAQAPERFGLNVSLDVDADLRIPDRLNSDLLALVTEALSNIRRHTQAKSARVILRQTADRLELSISNPRDRDTPDMFLPQSIAWRVDQLGGRLQIDAVDTSTVVNVQIPL